MVLLDETEDDLIVLMLSGELSTRYSCSSLLDTLSLLKRDITALILASQEVQQLSGVLTLEIDCAP